MNYAPAVESANRLASTPLGPDHTMAMFDQIKAAGRIQYAFLVGVFENKTKQPVYFVSCELNTMPELGGGSHFLCTFDGDGHGNCGASDDWGDSEKFFKRAKQMVQQRFGVAEQEN